MNLKPTNEFIKIKTIKVQKEEKKKKQKAAKTSNGSLQITVNRRQIHILQPFSAC